MDIIVCALAGILAGLGTGFAGLSAAVFIAPMLISFLNVDSFSAVGIALASDVLASAASAVTYGRHKNIDLKNGLLLMITVLVFAVGGSVASHFFTGLAIGENIMGWWLIIASLVLGLKFLIFPGKNERPEKKLIPLPNTLLTILSGIYIGFVCGFQGTGGGLMMLFVLNILLAVDFKKAVGTSVLIMSLTAFIGAGSHFVMRGFPDLTMLLICVAFTLFGAMVSSYIANRILPKTLKRVTGVLMVVSCIAMLIVKILHGS